MTKPIFISVVVAAYNATSTLEACINSIACQTHGNLEILIVDDVSTDETLALAQKLAKQDERIKVIARKKNGGPAAARNSALDIATGEWIAVVDSDDTILPNRLSDLLKIAQEKNAEIVFDNLFYIEYNARPNTPLNIYLPQDLNIEGEVTMAEFVESHVKSSRVPCLGFLKPMIRRDALEKNNIRYNQNLTIGEDTMLILNLLTQGARTYITPNAWYQYRRRPGSLSTKQNTSHMRAYDSTFRKFLEESTNLLKPDEYKAVKELLTYNRQRIEAREAIENLFQKNGVARILNDFRSPEKTKLILQEAASKIKRKLRSILQH